MWQTIRYRRLQALTIALLAALVTTSAVFAPLYSRAMQQAITRVELDRATVATRGVALSASSNTESEDGSTSIVLPEPADLLKLVSPTVLAAYGPPVYGRSAEVSFEPVGQVSTEGTILWRSHVCDHLRIVQGRCPRSPGEIAISSADARNFHLTPGQVVSVDGVPSDPSQAPPSVPLSVVGVYRQLPSPSWFGLLLTGKSGASNGPTQSHDDWVTASATFHSDLPTLPDPGVSAQLPLLVHRVGVDQLLRLSRSLTALDRDFRETPSLEGYQYFSRLPVIARDVRHQREQTRTTVPLLMLQLGLLAVVVLWLVLGSATEQRRPETAVAMLRGRGRAGARALLLRELLPVTLAGVPLGAALALGLCWFTRTVLLPGSAPLEVGWTAVLTLVGSALLLSLTTLLATVRSTREPVERLLRRVPVRRAGWSMGVGEALLVAASGAAVLAFVTGSLTGPVALVAPAVLALFVGVLLAHATSPLATLAGRRLLRRGRVEAGVSVLEAARTPAGRRTVAIVTVASALLVFAVSAVIVGATNRTLAAEQQAGAPVTAQVSGNDLRAVRAAVREADPSGRRATAVVEASPSSDDSTRTMAVDPVGFRAIAFFPQSVASLSRLAPGTPAPVKVRGDTLQATVTTTTLSTTGPSRSSPTAELDLELLNHAGDVGTLSLGALSQTSGETRQVTRTIPCSDGCYLIGLTIDTSPSASVRGSVTLSDLTAGSSSVALGPAGRWTPYRAGSSSLYPTSTEPTSLTLSIHTTGAERTTLEQRWYPHALPALVSGGGRPRTTTGLSGEDRRVRTVGTLPRVPGGTRHTILVDLDQAARATTPAATDQTSVWFSSDDPGLYASVSRRLSERGLRLSGRTTLNGVRSRYDDSAAAWSLDLGVVVGVAALLLAVMVVVVLAATSWRSRVRDLAALRLTGLSRTSTRRVATLAQLPPLLVAVVGGAVCGALGAHLTLADVPLFASAPAVSTLDLSLPWLGIVVVTAIALVVLVAVGWGAGRTLARRADLQRVRETW